jgi:hypothetical protein
LIYKRLISDDWPRLMMISDQAVIAFAKPQNNARPKDSSRVTTGIKLKYLLFSIRSFI